MQQITISVDIPDDFEVVGYQIPNVHIDYYINPQGSIVNPGPTNTQIVHPRIVLRKKWKQPDFLAPGWIWHNGRDWYWSDTKPTWHHTFGYLTAKPCQYTILHCLKEQFPISTYPLDSLREIK